MTGNTGLRPLTLRRLLLALVAFSLSWGSALARPIDEIVFEGNEVTKVKVLRQELLIHEGDEANAKKIEASRQAIMNLGLFKSVTSRLDEEGTILRLVFIVEERYYILPIPLLGANQEEEKYNYGIEIRHDNVGGLNHRLKVEYEHEQIIDNDTPPKKQVSLKYTIPRLVGTPFALSLNGKHTSKYTEEFDDAGTVTGSFLQEVNSGGISVSRWVEPNWISQGWTVGTGIGATERSYHQQEGTALTYEDSQTIALSAGIHYKEVEEHLYHRAGSAYGYTISVAEPDIGSDYDFTRHELKYQRYQPLKHLDANINTQFQLNVANGRAFQAPTYSIGNSALLRGYENDYREGEAMLLFNIEYHHHISGYRQLRAVIFADAGNVWQEPLDMDLGDLPVGVGVGLRWRVQSFVNLTLRVDYAQALEYDHSTMTMTTAASF